jgi:hypothetical protein
MAHGRSHGLNRKAGDAWFAAQGKRWRGRQKDEVAFGDAKRFPITESDPRMSGEDNGEPGGIVGFVTNAPLATPGDWLCYRGPWPQEGHDIT